jgi:hypothetical protein
LRRCGSACGEHDDCGDSRVEANAGDHVRGLCGRLTRLSKVCALRLDLGRRTCSVPW